MSNLFAKIKSNQLFKNSAIFFTGTFAASLGSYFFHFLMARMLSVEGYGELQSLIALIAIFGIPASALSVVIVKYVATFKAREENGRIYSLFTAFTKKLLIAGCLVFVFFALLSRLAADFLQIDSVVPVIILSLSFAITFLTPVNNGILNGLQKFKELSAIGVIGVFFKIVLAVVFVWLGFGVNGAVGAIVLSGFIGYFISFWPLKFLLKDRKKETIDTREILKYSLPVFFSLLFTALVFNLDLILVKHFMSPELAGQYGALAIVGRIIFFAVGPIVAVMFPMVAQAHANGGNHLPLLKNSLAMVGAIGCGALAFYFLLPSLVIRMLVGGKFLAAAPYLGWFGVAILFYSLAYLLVNYLLSIHRTGYIFLLAVAVALQVALISFYHDSLWQIVMIMDGVMAFLVVSLAIFSYRKLKSRI